MLVRDVAAALSAEFLGDGSLPVERLVHPAAAERASDLAIAISGEAHAALASSKARAAVVKASPAAQLGSLAALILAKQDRAALAILTALFDPGPGHAPGVHRSAIVASDAVLGEGISIGPFVSIGARSRIGARSVILGNVTIGDDVAIGDDALIYAGVRLGDRVRLGARVIVQANAVIGCDGFSFLPPGAAQTLPGRIHSLGNVEIGDDVEIGAGTTIARATLQTTRIGAGTKIDNLVQIGHNVTIGRGCLICGMVGLSGSVEVGDRVLLAGGVGVKDHVKIGTGAMVAAGSGVGSNVPPGETVSGYPALPHNRSTEMFSFLMRYKRVGRDLEDLKTRLEAIEKSKQKT
jgi:UDP-3-O-[3-hydroxymyristoyl] glucosamine N-acyltransferase